MTDAVEASRHPEITDIESVSNGASGIPALDINKVIRLVTAVAMGDKTPEQATKEFARPYKEFAEIFVKDNARMMIQNAIEGVGIHELANEEFADSLIDIGCDIAVLVHKYMTSEINEKTLIKKIGGVGICDVCEQVLGALGIDEKLGVENPADIMKLSPQVVAYNASIAAYKELRQALDELDAAHERRVEIEAACRESIAMIRQYREEMDVVVNEYLTTHLETFESGFAAMDKAIIDNDIDGYIKGNVDIQTILGYNVQFNNQDEFDALMDSDEAFVF